MVLADPDAPTLDSRRLTLPDAVRAVGACARAGCRSLSIAVARRVLAGSALFFSGYSLGRAAAADPGTPGLDDAAFQPFWDTYHAITDRYAGGEVDQRPSSRAPSAA